MPTLLDLKQLIGSKSRPVPEEAHDAMLRTLTLQDLKALGSLRPLRRIIELHIRYRIRSLFAAFQLPCGETLDMMGSTGSIVSGSGALDIIIPGLRVPRDLNLYCPRGSAEAVVKYLASKQYIIQLPSVTWNNIKAGRLGRFNVNNGVISLHRFTHVTKPTTVTLVESAASSPVLPIMFFHNTFLMNYYDAREVRCLYPALTFKMIGLHNRSNGFDRLHKQSLGIKWERLGVSLLWTCETTHSHQAVAPSTVCSLHPSLCQRADRSSDDGLALRIPFKTTVKAATEVRLSWQLGYFRWATTSVEYRDTQVTVHAPATGAGMRYSNTKTAHKMLNWRVYWENEDDKEGRTDIANTSFP